MSNTNVTLTVRLVDRLSGVAARVAQSMQGIGRGSAALAARMERASRASHALGSNLQRIGRSMSMAVTAPLVGAGAAIFKTGADFEQTMSRMVGLVGIAKKEVDSMKPEMLQISRETGRSMQELGETMFFITSAGLRGSAAMATLRASAQAAAAGLGESKEVADAATSAVNAFGEKNLSAEKAVGILVAAVREGKLEASSLAPVLGRVIPVAAELHVGFDQVAASVAAMSRLGLDAAESTTALRGILNKLLKPDEQGEKTLAKFHLSTKKLREELEQKGLLSVLLHLRDVFRDHPEAMGKVFPDIEALAGVLNLVGKNVEETKRIFASLADESGQSLRKAFDAAKPNAWLKIGQAMASLREGMLKLAEVLVPVVVPLIERLGDRLKSLADWFARLSPRMQKFTIVASGIAAALGPALIAFGLMAHGIGFALSGFAFLLRGAGIVRLVGLVGRLRWGMVAVRGLATAATMLGGALAGLSAPVLAVAAAIGVVAIGIYKYWQPIKAFVSGVVAGIARHIGPALRGIADFADRLAGAIESILAPIEPVIRAFRALGRMIFGDDPAKAATRFSTLTAGLVDWAKSLFAPVELSEQARASWEAYGNAVVDAIAAIPGRIAGAVAGLGQKMFGDDPAKAATRISTWVAGIVQKISGAFEALGSVDLADAATKLMQSLLDRLKSAATRVEQWVTGWVDWLKNKFSFTARPKIEPQGAPPSVLDVPQAVPQSAPMAPRSGPRERHAMNLVPSRGNVTVNQGPVTFNVASNDAEGAARAIMRALDRRRQAGMWDGALA